MPPKISSPAIRVLLGGLLATAAPAALGSPAAYTVTDLGTLGGTQSQANGLNARGQVVGTVTLRGGIQHGFVWDSTSRMQDLTALFPGYSSGLAINSARQIAGTWASGSVSHAFFYDHAGLHDLPTLGGVNATGTGINDSAQVVGGAETPTPAGSSPVRHAFVWDQAHGIRDIGTPGAGISNALGINRRGQITGWQSQATSGMEHAFLFDPLNGLQDLGTLPGGTFSDGDALNDLAQVVATADTSTASGDHGALFSGGTVVDLGTLGGYYSGPSAINNHGQIVGSSETGPGFGPQHAALLFPGGAVDLNTLIDPASGWVLGSASGINDSGQIVGSGTVNGETHGFLLTPVGTDQAVAYQGGPTHAGAVGTFNFGLPLAKKWTVDLGQSLSYPLIAGGKVFVIAGGNAAGTTPKSLGLYALDAATGATVWGPVSLLGAYPWAAAAYDGGQVFTVNTDGLLRAFDAATGTPLWSRVLPGQYSFSAPPTARNGVVYVGGAGSGGTLYALRESDGTTLWTAGVMNGDASSPAVTPEGVYVSYAGPQVYKFDPQTGALLWHSAGPSEGGGGATPVYADGRLYVRGSAFGSASTGYYGGVVLDAGTGAQQRTFDPGYNGRGPAPAFDIGRGFFVSGGALQAQDAATGAVLWTDTPAGAPYVTAPVVVSGIVFEGASDGTLDALDPATGGKLWTDAVGAPLSGPDEINVSQPLTGLGAGEGLLVVPAGHLLAAYAAVPPRPIPTLIGVLPARVPARQGGFTLVLYGTGFAPGVQAFWNGKPLRTNRLSPTQIRAGVTGSLTATPGTALVTVVNPLPGGGPSGTWKVPVYAL